MIINNLNFDSKNKSRHYAHLIYQRLSNIKHPVINHTTSTFPIWNHQRFSTQKLHVPSHSLHLFHLGGPQTEDHPSSQLFVGKTLRNTSSFPFCRLSSMPFLPDDPNIGRLPVWHQDGCDRYISSLSMGLISPSQSLEGFPFESAGWNFTGSSLKSCWGMWVDLG